MQVAVSLERLMAGRNEHAKSECALGGANSAFANLLCPADFVIEIPAGLRNIPGRMRNII
jgi:hypothetical protein